jgi:hypothetical protein
MLKYLLGFLIVAGVAQAQSEDGLDRLADRVAVADQLGQSDIDLNRLEAPLRKVVEAGMIALGKSQRLNLASSAEYTDLTWQEILLEGQRLVPKFPYLNVDLELQREESEQRLSFKGRVERFYNAELSGRKQQFRERFTISEPAVLSGHVFLTVRPSDPQVPDFVWHYSPLGEVYQELDQSLRDDEILDFGLSLNDFFGLSARTNLLELQGESSVTAFIPVYVERAVGASADIKNVSSCLEVDNRALSQGISTAAAVRRKLVKLNLLVSDPFSWIGRRVIFLDAETLVPVFAETYDRSDRLVASQVVLTKAVELRGQSRLIPVATFLIQERKKARSALWYKSYIFCDAQSALTPIEEFDPERLIPERLRPKQKSE